MVGAGDWPLGRSFGAVECIPAPPADRRAAGILASREVNAGCTRAASERAYGTWSDVARKPLQSCNGCGSRAPRLGGGGVGGPAALAVWSVRTFFQRGSTCRGEVPRVVPPQPRWPGWGGQSLQLHQQVTLAGRYLQTPCAPGDLSPPEAHAHHLRKRWRLRQWRQQQRRWSWT